VIDDAYDLRTPEQIDLQYDLAGLGSRFMAIALDTLIQTVVILALGAVFGFGMALIGLSSRDLFGRDPNYLFMIGIAVAILLIFLLNWGYFLIFELIWSGQTPGKRWAGIRVLTVRGEPVTLIHVLVRNLMRLVDMLPSSYTIGIICILVSRRGQRLGDMVAGTVVVRERRAELPGTLPPIDPSRALPPQIAAAFSTDDIRLARDFLLRAPTLPSDRRAELARQIAQTLRARMAAASVLPPSDLTNERLLAGVAALRA
jgi:uncharacterized RDD family membrane protein YckC